MKVPIPPCTNCLSDPCVCFGGLGGVMIATETPVVENGRVIGYVGTNEENKLFARTPGHGWEFIDLQAAAGKSNEEAIKALRYALSANYFSEVGYL